MGNLGESTSGKMQLNHVDWKKTGRLLLVVLVGQLLTFGANFVLGIDFGALNGIVGSVVSAGLELARRFLTDYTQ